MANPFESMDMPCPLDICDGSGILPALSSEDDERPCPHTVSEEHDNDEV